MAHNLATIQTGELAGKSSFVTVQKPAWHQLGQVVDNPLTVEEALFQAGLNFQVEKTPVLYSTNGEPLQMEEKFVTYREDTNQALGVVGKRYEILQNREALSFFDTIVGEREAVIQTAGALFNGSQVFVTALMPEHIHVPGDGEIRMYINLFNSHDGNSPIQAFTSPTRIVCWNTLQVALGNTTNRVVLRHTSGAKGKFAQAAQLMGVYDKLARELETAFDQMVHTRVSEDQVEALIKRLFPSSKETKDTPASKRAENIREQVKSYMFGETGGQQTHPGTAYQAYNGITGYFQNVKNYRSTQGKLVNSLLGEDSKTMMSAFKHSLALS